MEKIKICIVEDELEFQKWILRELSETPNIICEGKYTKGEDATANIPEINPDIVIMDLTLKGSKFNGVETMLRLKLVTSDIKFLVISSHSDEGKVFEALKVGAGAYLHKEDIPDNLAKLIIEFKEGGAPMSPGIAQMVINSFHKSVKDMQLLQKLTDREEELLKLLASGYLYKEIANKMGIKEGTVKQHAHKIYLKLQVNNKTEAIKKYLNY